MSEQYNIHLAFLRAVNVGGTGKLSMNNLINVCTEAGARNVKTYIASGNAYFLSQHTTAIDRKLIETGLSSLMGKDVECLVFDLQELSEIIDQCPFQEYPGNQHVAILLDRPSTEGDALHIKGRKNELIALGPRCIYAFYPDGIGKSKLVIPAAQKGTARNFNTLRKMHALASSLPDQ